MRYPLRRIAILWLDQCEVVNRGGLVVRDFPPLTRRPESDAGSPGRVEVLVESVCWSIFGVEGHSRAVRTGRHRFHAEVRRHGVRVERSVWEELDWAIGGIEQSGILGWRLCGSRYT